LWVIKVCHRHWLANKCIALKAEVVEKKGIFVYQPYLLLKDCQGNVIFKGKEGKSREKEYQAAYDEALRNAFSSLNERPTNMIVR